MKTKIFSLVLFFLVSGFVYAQNVPELIYYKFENNTVTTTPNYASAPVGTNPAPIIGNVHPGPGGQFDSCLVGNLPAALGNISGVNTGWNTSFPANWTMSFWLGAGLVDGDPSYICGDPGVGSFRVFFGGIAGANTIGIRGPIANTYMTNIYTGTAMVCHIVWDGTNIIAYKNGVLFATYPRTFTTTTGGTGFRVGSYNTAAVSHILGKLDEFRFYNRALTPAEITATWNVELPVGGSTCNYYSSQWCALGAFPVLPAAMIYHSAAWLGDTLYVQTTTSGGAGQTTVIRYTWGGSWTTGVPCLVGVTGATMTACNGKLYLIGGGTTSIASPTNNVQEYNPATGTWTAKAPIPVTRSAHGAVCWGDSVIFVLGGPYSSPTADVYYYRPASNTWGTSTAFTGGRRTFGYGLIGGNKIIVSTGWSGSAYLNSTYVGTIGANATTISWVAGPNAPTALSRPGSTAYNNYFYLVGGDTTGTAGKSPRVNIFNAQTNTWFYTVNSNPNPASNIFSAVTAKCINDTVRIFQPGGSVTSSTVASNVFVVLGCGPTITGNGTITSTVPGSYSLSQNYPNPFNPATKISFSLPKTGNVKLVVYDILGKEVTTLVNDYRTAGTHEITFNAQNLASGVYLYRIEAGDFRDVKKMLLVK